MPRPTRLLAFLLVAASLAGCSRADGTATSGTQTVSASGGEVAPGQAAPAAAPSATPAAAPAPAPGALTDSVSVLADKGRIRGAATAGLWVIEISDFQCPYCKQWHDSTFASLDRDYIQTGKARLAYLNFPLTSIHPNAQAAAEAAMCGSVQGKFWQMHDALFDGQASWESAKDPMPVFTAMARKAGIEEGAWRSCVTTHATAPLIAADHDRVAQRGIRSTPSFFVGPQRIEGVVSYPAFKFTLDQQLAKTPAR